MWSTIYEMTGVFSKKIDMRIYAELVNRMNGHGTKEHAIGISPTIDQEDVSHALLGRAVGQTGAKWVDGGME